MQHVTGFHKSACDTRAGEDYMYIYYYKMQIYTDRDCVQKMRVIRHVCAEWWLNGFSWCCIWFGNANQFAPGLMNFADSHCFWVEFDQTKSATTPVCRIRAYTQVFGAYKQESRALCPPSECWFYSPFLLKYSKTRKPEGPRRYEYMLSTLYIKIKFLLKA